MRPSHPSYHLTVTVVPTFPSSCPVVCVPCRFKWVFLFTPQQTTLRPTPCFATLNNIDATNPSTVLLPCSFTHTSIPQEPQPQAHSSFPHHSKEALTYALCFDV